MLANGWMTLRKSVGIVCSMRVVLSLMLWLATVSRCVVLPRPPAPREPPVTSSDLPKQIPPPPPPSYASTPHYDQQLARLLWVTNTPYPVYQHWQ